MQHGDPLRQLHDHLHIVLDDQDRQILGDAAHQLHGAVGLGRAHAGGRLVEAPELRLGGERNADLEVALLAVREIGGKLAAHRGRFRGTASLQPGQSPGNARAGFIAAAGAAMHDLGELLPRAAARPAIPPPAKKAPVVGGLGAELFGRRWPSSLRQYHLECCHRTATN